MARNPESFAKRAREIAVKERRDRKRAKKVEAAAQQALAEGQEGFKATSDTPEQR